MRPKKTYIKLILNSVGGNPRTIKRLVNLHHFLSSMGGDLDEKLLFKLLCFQLRWDVLYKTLVKKLQRDLDSFDRLNQSKKENINQILESLEINEIDNLSLLQAFVKNAPRFPKNEEIKKYRYPIRGG